MIAQKKLLSLAYYLPQFHEIEENNRWWGKGFTEWQQLREAKQYYPWQAIRKPIAPFGEYSLLNPAVMEWQNQTAKKYGIDSFLVFDYWFGKGKTLLEKPMQMVLDQQLNFDYCLCWANHTWYNKRENITLQEQQYLGAQDYAEYFNRLLPHFRSSHYLKIENQPVFAIFNPNEVPDLSVFTQTFQQLAQQTGFAGIHFIADNTDASSSHANLLNGYTRTNYFFKKRNRDNIVSYLKEKLTRKFGWNQLGPFCYSYRNLVVDQYQDFNDSKFIPSVFTGWDTTPRHLKRGTILTDFTVQNFKLHLEKIAQTLIKNRAQKNQTQLVIIKSWNEWAEGNLLEPDSVFGEQLLESYRTFTLTLLENPQDLT